MNGRELVILLLGLAIVAVVIRGLFVAITVRRGQIKLAIDKNIPQNVDLESLELAELPGGGARVANRSLEEVNRYNNALNLAETKAKSLNLADVEDCGHIPVLMDAVGLSAPASEAEVVASEGKNESMVEDFISHSSQEQYAGEGWDEDEADLKIEGDHPEPQADIGYLAHNDHDSGSLLSGYDEEGLEEDELRSNLDTMSSVAPDYTEESEFADEAEELAPKSAEIADDDSYTDHEGNHFDEHLNEQAELSERELAGEQQDQPALFNADSSVDEFSMSAGDRIGGNPPSIGDADPSGLLDDIDEDATKMVTKPKNRRTLFSVFGRKSKRKSESINDVQSAFPAVASIEMEEPAAGEPHDVLLEKVYAQVNNEVAEHEEPAYSGSVADEQIGDKLDQDRAASLEIEHEGQGAHSDEFEHSEVLVINVTAKDGRVFFGDDLLENLIASGLKFGDMNIFHKRLSKDRQGTVIFSVANMLNPGTFDLNNMGEFTTLGISFFLALPTCINNLDAFEQMLDKAQEIRATLDGDLKDDHKNGMTGQTIEHYRQRVRDFELRRLKALALRG